MTRQTRQAPACKSDSDKVAPTAPGSEAREGDAAVSNAGRLIVVVDDDPGVLRLLRESLQTEGYTVVTAADGRAGLRLIADVKPALVILDVVMPTLDGFEVCERVRRFTNVPIVMLTVKNRSDEVLHCLEMGADDCLAKPFNLDELLARTKAILRRTSQRHRMQPQLSTLVA
ncbi:MAG: response regulator [Chloroflexi bacterium]|nr:response regulator [Chloroflexota bacterium]